MMGGRISPVLTFLGTVFAQFHHVPKLGFQENPFDQKEMIHIWTEKEICNHRDFCRCNSSHTHAILPPVL